jgi:hypothetical protein
MKKLLFLVLMSLLFVSNLCAGGFEDKEKAHQKADAFIADVKKLVGESRRDLVEVAGAPDEILKIDDGLEIYKYQRDFGKYVRRTAGIVRRQYSVRVFLEVHILDGKVSKVKAEKGTVRATMK